LSYTSNPRREIVYYTPDMPGCKAFPSAGKKPIRAARSQAHHQRDKIDAFIIPSTSLGEQEALRKGEGGLSVVRASAGRAFPRWRSCGVSPGRGIRSGARAPW